MPRSVTPSHARLQDQLLAEGVSLAVNVKGKVLDRLARCTETEIATNLDSLSKKNSVMCGEFHLEEVTPRPARCAASPPPVPSLLLGVQHSCTCASSRHSSRQPLRARVRCSDTAADSPCARCMLGSPADLDQRCLATFARSCVCCGEDLYPAVRLACRAAGASPALPATGTPLRSPVAHGTADRRVPLNTCRGR